MLKKLFNFSILLILATTLIFTGLANAELVKKGLVAYWPLEDKDALDAIGKNHGELNGSPKVVAGKVGNGMKFDGQNFVDIKGTEVLDFAGKDEMTVAAWVNAENAEPVVGVVAGCCGTIVAQRNLNSWALRFDGRNGGAEFEFIVCPGWQGDTTNFGIPKDNVKPGEWHYLTGIVSKNKVFLYLDGVLAKEGNYTGPMTGGGTKTEIGRAGDGGFIGIIDEVTIYNRALSAAEVKQNFMAKGMAVDKNSKLSTCWGNLKRI